MQILYKCINKSIPECNSTTDFLWLVAIIHLVIVCCMLLEYDWQLFKHIVFDARASPFCRSFVCVIFFFIETQKEIKVYFWARVMRMLSREEKRACSHALMWYRYFIFDNIQHVNRQSTESEKDRKIEKETMCWIRKRCNIRECKHKLLLSTCGSINAKFFSINVLYCIFSLFSSQFIIIRLNTKS